MRFRGATATAVLALALGGCIYPEPINEVPTPVDSAPTIQQAFPTTHQVPLLPPLASNPEQDCYVDVGLDSVLSPQGAQLYAQFILNYNQSSTSPGQSIPVGQALQLALQQDPADANAYLLAPVELPLTQYSQSLFPLIAGQPVNVLTVFVSDGFNPDNPTQASAGHYVTSWDWQVTVADPTSPCATKLNDLAQ